jgi:uncharacterized protein YsxB (DUF464 family)
MIRVSVQRSEEQLIRKVVVEGHAEFSKHGKDIVCAGVSAVTVGTVNAVESLLQVKLNCTMRDGLLKLDIPVMEQSRLNDQLQLLLESMIIMLMSIKQSYGKYITIQEIPYEGGV